MMKKYLLIISVFLLNVTLHSQDFIKSDTLKVVEEIYNVSHLSFGNSSSTKAFKVLTCDVSEFSKIKSEIINCYRKRKIDYTEFYIVCVPNYIKIESKKENNILLSFLNKIDKERMRLNLYTALIKLKYDLKSNVFEYYLNQPRKKLSEFQEYKLNIKAKEICRFMQS